MNKNTPAFIEAYKIRKYVNEKFQITQAYICEDESFQIHAFFAPKISALHNVLGAARNVHKVLYFFGTYKA